MKVFPNKSILYVLCLLQVSAAWGEVVTSVTRTSFSTEISVGLANMQEFLNQNTEVTCEEGHEHLSSISDCLFNKSTDNGKSNSPVAKEYCRNIHIRFPSMLDCIDQARRQEGLNLSIQDARRFCQQKSIRYYSLIDCVGQQQSAAGMNLNEEEARSVCQRMPIAYSSRAECLEQAKSERGLNLNRRNAEAYCQNKTIAAPPAGTYRSLTDCVAQTGSKEQCQGANIHYPSLRDCVDQAGRRTGLQMKATEAKNFCAGVGMEFGSLIQCVDQHYDRNGLNLGMNVARERCQNYPITFSTPLECTEQASGLSGLQMGSAHMYCRNARYETLPRALCEVQANTELFFDMHSTEPAEYCQRIGAR